MRHFFGRPQVARDKYDDQQEEQAQEIDVDRADAFVTFVVRLKNGFEHMPYLRGRRGYPCFPRLVSDTHLSRRSTWPDRSVGSSGRDPEMRGGATTATVW